MFTALSEKLRKFTAVTLITTLMFSFTAPAFAANVGTLDSLTINGSSSVTVTPSSTIAVSVSGTFSGSTRWKSTEYKIGSGSSICIDIVDVQNATFTHNFNITAPASVGTSNFTVTLHGNDTCSSSNATSTLNNGITVTADSIAPTFTLTTLSSNNAVTTSAKSGDIVTAVFTTSETLVANPTVTFGGQAMTFGTLVGNTYTYTRTLTGTETAGSAALLVTGSDLIPNTTTDSNIGTLTTDFTAPATPSFVSPAANSFLTTAALDKIDWTDVTDSSAPVTYVYSSSFSATTNIDGSFTAPIYTSGALSPSEIATAGTPAGVYYVSVKAVDAVGNSGPWTTPIQITVDNSAPTLTVPANMTEEATSSAGKAVTFSPIPTATDNHDSTPTILCTPVSGSIFPIGTSPVSCTATDDAGNTSAAGNFTVTVQDTTAPVITAIGNNTRNTSHNGAYTDPGATCADSVDTSCSVVTTYSLPIDTSILGSVYSVYYNAMDIAGNPALQITQTVTVVDTTIPIITVNPTTVVVAQNSGVYTDTGVTALDDADGDITTNIVRGGATVDTAVIGDYVITYDVSDAALNPALQQNRTVQVRDLTAPTATSVSIASNNTNPTLAKEGDVITVSFTTSEPVNPPTATIAGKTAVVTNTGGNNYTATYTLTATETQGVAAIALNFSDIVGNAGSQVTATTNASSVTIDIANPIVSSLVANTNSPLSAAISFATNEVATSTIQYGLTNTYGTTTTIAGALTQNHAITLTGLTQCDVYHYSLTVTDAAGNIYTSPDNSFQVNCNVLGGGGGGISAGPIFTSPTFAPTPIPTTTTNPTPAPAPTPTTTPTPESTPAVTPTAQPTDTTTPTNNTPEITPAATPTTDNSELVPTSFPNESTETGGTTTGTTGGTTTGGGTGGTTTGSTFNPADATLDVGGGVTPEEPTVEPAPTEIPQDIGGGVVPEEESHTLAWTLLGLVVLLNFAWFYTRKNSVPTR